MVLCIGLATISMVHACKFYIHNDGPRTIFVYDETQKQHFEIMPKRKILVGDPVKHAHCTVYYKSSADPIAEFRMIACATPGMSTDVTMTELLAGRVPEIFEVIAIERSQKPAKKAGGCSSCQAKLE
jgi:hypothetical protein